ncbi:hypothetical protein Hanom_Chr13g01186601 [Helianthus anomalus]
MALKIKKLEEVNQTLNQLLSEISEASSPPSLTSSFSSHLNEMKKMKLEMEAMKADKVMKDEQLFMLYSVIENHLNIDVHAAFNEIEVKRAEEHRIERERRLVEKATQKNKGVIEETQEAGGSSSQVDVEMVEAEANPMGFVLVGESSSPSFDLNDILRRVNVIQRKKKAKEVLMLKWKEEEEVEEESQNFARGEIVDSDSDMDILGDEDENEDEDENDKSDKKDDKNDDDDDDNDDQGATGLLIVNPNVEQRIEDFLNNEINEQEDDDHQEASTSGNQNVDQVFLTQPTVIFLNAPVEGELEIPRSRAEMLEELGLDHGKFKFDIEDEIPRSPERI